MGRLADGFGVLILTCWVGALWSIGYIAAPVLFSALSDRLLAGTLAGQLFAVVGWLGLAAGAYLLAWLRWRDQAPAGGRRLFWVVLLMTLLAAVQLFGLQPLIAQLRAERAAGALEQGRFAWWHGVASVLYLAQSLLGAAAMLGVARRQR